MKYAVIIVFFALSLNFSKAQTQRIELSQTGLFKQTYSPNEAQIYIYSDPRIWKIINEQKKSNTNKHYIRGWRIRVYMGSGRNAFDEAENVKMKVRTYFSEINAYIIHQSPYFQVMAGDFRSRIEAEAFRKKMLAEFPDCYVVESKVKIK